MYQVRVGLSITQSDAEDDLDDFTDKFVEELAALNDEADLGGSVATGQFMVAVAVDAQAPFDALQAGTVLIKTAAHAAGGHTAGITVPSEWPTSIHEVSLAADPIEVPVKDKELVAV